MSFDTKFKPFKHYIFNIKLDIKISMLDSDKLPYLSY